MIQKADDQQRKRLADSKWGLLIVDEAHHAHKSDTLYKTLHQLSSRADRALILSATPIQRQVKEFFKLLKLMNPAQYDVMSPEEFEHIREAQKPVLDTILDVRDDMSVADFDAEDFLDYMGDITPLIEDPTFDKLLNEINTVQIPSIQRTRALEALAYLGTYYRIDSHILRNRRATLTNIDLSTRECDESYAYTPTEKEISLCDDVYEYLTQIKQNTAGVIHQFTLEWSRLLLSALFSSPEALMQLLSWRKSAVSSHVRQPTDSYAHLLNPAAPREEDKRIQQLVHLLPTFDEEVEWLDRIQWSTESLAQRIEHELSQTRYASLKHPFRFAQIIQAIKDQLMKRSAAKVILFSAWRPTLAALKPHLEKATRNNCKLVEFHCGMSEEALQQAAELFQSTDDHNILLCDELGGEGRNFQMADMIIHIDLPWTPAKIEQRIGRVDRLGRSGIVRSIVPYAIEQVEGDLFTIWEEAFSLFSRSMSGMEIALETILEQLLTALDESVRDGLVNIQQTMIDQAEQIRTEVEREAYFNEIGIDRERRNAFNRVSNRYRDGELLGKAFKKWSEQIGLECNYNEVADILTYFPRKFNSKMMQNAHYIQPPNMVEALVRSGRQNTQQLKGTFNRGKAVLREQLIFYSPGSDPWTQTILENVLQADRGRCSAILRFDDRVTAAWSGFEFAYRIMVDPRHLYALGLPSIYVSYAQEYLPLTWYTILVSEDGDILPETHPNYEIVKHQWSHKTDTHLGRRAGQHSPIAEFKAVYDSERWKETIDTVTAAVQQHLTTHLEDEYALGDTDYAREQFEQRLNGQRATVRWKHRATGSDPSEALASVDADQPLYEALLAGIEKPWVRLESVTYWQLRKGNE